jgi:hypothetical protein
MGQEFVAQESSKSRGQSALGVDGAEVALVPSLDTGTLKGIRLEIGEYRQKLTHLDQLPISEVMGVLSGIAGRLAELRADLFQLNSQSATSCRTKLLDPLRADLDFHYKCWSRSLAEKEWELRMSGGGT